MAVPIHTARPSHPLSAPSQRRRRGARLGGAVRDWAAGWVAEYTAGRAFATVAPWVGSGFGLWPFQWIHTALYSATHSAAGPSRLGALEPYARKARRQSERCQAWY